MDSNQAPETGNLDGAALLQAARANHAAGRLEQAIQLYRRALDRNQRNADALHGLGQATAVTGDLDEAARLMRRACKVNRKFAQCHVDLAQILAQRNHFDESGRALTKALEIEPKNVRALCIQATNLELQHKADEAMKVARRAVSIEPDDARANVTLAHLEHRGGDLASARDRLEDVIRRGNLDWEMRAQAGHELGFVLQQLGEDDASFDAFIAAGAADLEDPRVARLDRDSWVNRIELYQSDLTPDLVGRWTPELFRDERPDPGFLVGFPRSGTTMSEQIMAAHPNAITSNEEPLLGAMGDELIRLVGEVNLTEMLRRADEPQIRALRAHYWREAASVLDRNLSGKTLIDKLPINIVHIGLINVVFPDARIIVALRDPRDVCLSCFQQHFEMNEAMINFTTWEQTCRFYARVMGFYLDIRDRLTVPRLEIRYEDTVQDLESQGRRIIDFLGLEWTDDILQFHERARSQTIHTPSFVAVTEAVNTRAVARWKRHSARYTPEIQQLLAPFIDAFGYESF